MKLNYGKHFLKSLLKVSILCFVSLIFIVNAEFVLEWNPDDIVKTGTVPPKQAPDTIARVHKNSEQPSGVYLAPAKDLEDGKGNLKSRDEISQDLALPYPENTNFVSDYKGTKPQKAMLGPVGKNDWGGKSGTTQIKLDDRPKDTDFYNSPKPVPSAPKPEAPEINTSAKNRSGNSADAARLARTQGYQGASSAKPTPMMQGESIVPKRTFTSDDKHVGDVANKIEEAYPGHVVGVNVPVRDTAGNMVTDADILLKNAVIQVKSGGGKGMTSQLQRTEQATGLPTLGYGPDLKQSILKNSASTNDLQTLIDVVKP